MGTTKSIKIQDSLYQQVGESARRQFDAGQIDYLAKTFSEAQYGQVHNQFLQAQADYTVTLHQLQTYSSIKKPFEVPPISRIILGTEERAFSPSPTWHSLPHNIYHERGTE